MIEFVYGLGGEAIALLCGLFWALAVVLFRYVGPVMPPFQQNGFKNIVAALCFTVHMVVMGRAFAPPDMGVEEWALVCLSGFLGITLSDLFFLHTLQRVGATLAAILSSLYVPTFIILPAIWHGERIGTVVVIGGALVVGAVILGSLDGARDAEGKRVKVWSGVLLACLYVGTLGVSIMMIREPLQRNPLWVSWLRLASGSVGVLLVLPWGGGWSGLADIFRPRPRLGWMVAGSILGSYLACGAWLLAFTLIPVSRAAVLNELYIIFVFILSALFLGEPFTLRRTLAVVVAFLGAAVANDLLGLLKQVF